MTRNSGGGWQRANVVDLAAPAVTQQWRRARPPFVLINMAMTADGKIATANRAVSSFGSRRDVAHLYELRATVDAVMCGARTAAAGEVYLDAGGPRYQRQRLKRGLAEFNLRVVVSGSGSLPATLPLFQRRFSPIIVLTTRRAGRLGLSRLAAAADEVAIGGERELDLPAALRWLAARWGVRRLLCEGGGELNAAMFEAGLVDELHLTICPLVFGGQEAPPIASGEGAKVLADATRLELQRCRRVGDELFCVFAVRPRQVPKAGDCPAPARRLSSRARKQ